MLAMGEGRDATIPIFFRLSTSQIPTPALFVDKTEGRDLTYSGDCISDCAQHWISSEYFWPLVGLQRKDVLSLGCRKRIITEVIMRRHVLWTLAVK